MNGLHEVHNRIKVKPYTELPYFGDEITDQQVAEIHWSSHKAREDSRIVDLFQGLRVA